MVTTRFFDGGRNPGKRSLGSELMRIQMMKKGSMTSAERFKYIANKKLDAHKKAAVFKTKPFALPGTVQQAFRMSKSTENALKEMAQKKAAKEAKALRKMVVIKPRNFPNGSLVKDGKVYDIAGNIVAKVNKKNGKISLNGLMGWSVGQYKPGVMTDNLIRDTIDKYSPYYLNLRKMQAMQAQHGVWGPTQDTINVSGANTSSNAINGTNYEGGYIAPLFGSDPHGPRQNIGVNAWGAQSDNVWGTFADDAWGRSMDNVWGTNSTDVWGGIGGNPFGNFAKTVKIWGSGNGHNYLRGLTARVAAFFGLTLKSKNTAAMHEALRTRNANRSSSARSSAATVRSTPMNRR